MSPPASTKKFAANLAAYCASEVAAKASRLLVVVAVARLLDLEAIGIAAAAIAAGDILKALTENGVGQRIIAARDDALEAACSTAHRLFWIWCLGLFGLQAALAGAMFWAGADPLLAGLILLMGLEYLFMPAGLVQVALAMRAGKLKQTAAIAGAQVVGANAMSILLVFIWPSSIALILPRVLSAPIWLLAVRHLHPWTPSGHVRAPLMPFLRYGWAVVSIEVVKAARLQADKVIVGATLGAETLGLYFMAFNAGLSLSNAFSTAFSTVLFPLLAQSENRLASLRHSMMVGVGLIAPLVILQALMAPVYVPALLGDRWNGIETLVQILCLLAIPTTLWATAAGWLRSHDRAEMEFFVTAVLAAGVVANAIVIGSLGLTQLVIGYASITTILMLGATALTLRPAFFPSTRQVTQ